MTSNKRKKNLIRPSLQLKITGVFMATSAAHLAVMGYMMIFFLKDGTGPTQAISDEVFPILVQTFFITLAVLVPATLVVGILATFLVAGPLYRFEAFLRSVQAGEKPADCRLRKGDELQGFCELLNDVTRPLRAEETRSSEKETSSEQLSSAA